MIAHTSALALRSCDGHLFVAVVVQLILDA
jgi:hypothetical protein